jgi:hypothetical protein
VTWRDVLPDVRDGLSRKERVVLTVLNAMQTEREGRNVPTAELYGRVLEHVSLSIQEMQDILRRFMGPPGAS